MATMDDVARTAELSKGTLYLYFKRKAELYLGIAYRAMTLLKQMFETAVASAVTGLEKVRAIGGAHYRYSRHYPNYFNMVVHYEASQMDQSSYENSLLQCHQLGKEVMDVVNDAVLAGIEDGTIRSDLDPLRTAYLLRGMSAGIIQTICREKEHFEKTEPFTAEKLMEDFMEMISYALKSKK